MQGTPPASTSNSSSSSALPPRRPNPTVVKPTRRQKRFTNVSVTMHVVTLLCAVVAALVTTRFLPPLMDAWLGGGQSANLTVSTVEADASTVEGGLPGRVVPATTLLQTPWIQNFSHLNAPCPSRAEKKDRFLHCLPPPSRCTRAVVDLPDSALPLPPLSDREQRLGVGSDFRARLVGIMDRVLDAYGRGGGSGPVSLVELQQGIFSLGSRFASLPKTIIALKKDHTGAGPPDLVLDPSDLAVVWALLKGIERRVAEHLFCPDGHCADADAARRAHRRGEAVLFLAPPSFYSRIQGNRPAQSENDEYWHLHIDRNQYVSFAVTTLLYLEDYTPAPLDAAGIATGVCSDQPSSDVSCANDAAPSAAEEGLQQSSGFTGGTFEFEGAVPLSVEPRRGRLLIFTSSEENPHRVAKVHSGVRRALTTAFTCDRSVGVQLGTSYETSRAFKTVHEALLFDPAETERRFGSFGGDADGPPQDPLEEERPFSDEL